MASQPVSIAKIVGDSSAVVTQRFHRWSAARTTDDRMEWSPEQWSIAIRRAIDECASQLRLHSHVPPVVYFNEHIDLWSMGDVFTRWLNTDASHQPIELHTDRYELWCYQLPDGHLLENRLRSAQHEHQEERWLAKNLLEAVCVWQSNVDKSVIVLLREVVGGLLEDSDVERSLSVVPDWISSKPRTAR